MKEPRFRYPVLEYRVIDGDTVECVLDLGWGNTKKVSIRILGVDAPESNTRRNLLEREAGKLVTRCVDRWLFVNYEDDLYASSETKPKYFGRSIGRIWAGSLETELSAFLIEKELVRPYDGGKREPWLDSQLNHIIDKANDYLGL